MKIFTFKQVISEIVEAFLRNAPAVVLRLFLTAANVALHLLECGQRQDNREHTWAENEKN